MTVHLPIPGPIQRQRTQPRQVRDETNVADYHVEPEPADQIRDAIAALDALDARMLALEARMDRLEARLNDPALAAAYGPTHPLRIEAEDRLAALGADWLAEMRDVRMQAWTIATRSSRLLTAGDTDALADLGRLLSVGTGALPRVKAVASEYLIYRGWDHLIVDAVPF